MKPTSEASERADLDAFSSVEQFDLEHHKLLEAQGESEDGVQLINEVENFVIRGRLLGATLETASVRQDCQSNLNYWAIFAYRTSRNRLKATLLPFDPASAPILDDSQFPYRFTEEACSAAQEMLGWRRLLDECERDLGGDHLLTVMGETDAGAHFLIHDLLVPRLRSGQARLQVLSGSEQWRYYEVPLGSDPISDLLGAIAAQDGHSPEWIVWQKKEFHQDRTTFRRILEAGSELPTVLVFSRFRAVLECSENDHLAFVNNLAHLLEKPQRRFYGIVTLNRDRSMPLSSFGPLEKPLRDGHVRLAFTMVELRHLVEEPARGVGLIFEPGLVDQILINIQGEPAALPLLRFTLERLWKLRERNRITWQAFEKTGAGRTALSKVMYEIHDELSEPQKEVLRQILLGMVRLEPIGSFTPSEVTQEDLYRTSDNISRVKEVLERLCREGLIRESLLDGSASYTLAHSALLISWPPLVDWLEDFRDNQRLRLRLRDAAEQWRSGGKHKDLLWQGKTLVTASELFGADATLSTLERDFLQASQRRAARKKRVLCVAVVVALFLVASGVVYQQKAVKRAKERQQMLAESMEHLTKGDLPAALLLLEHRDEAQLRFDRWGEEFGIFSADKDEERVEMIRKIAASHLPGLRSLAFSSKENNYSQEYGFRPVAVSPDYAYVAAIQIRNPQTTDGSQPKSAAEVTPVSSSKKASQLKGEKGPFSLTIRSLQHDWSPVELDLHPPIQAGTPKGGAVAFVNLASQNEPEYYLLASAGGLHAWKVPQGIGGEQPQAGDWEPMEIESTIPEETGLSRWIISIGAGRHGRILTIDQNDDERNLRLWTIKKGSNSNSIKVDSARLPEELKRKNNGVQMAYLSAEGTLLAICGKLDDARELKMWTCTQRGDDWVPVLPPTWVPGLERQRLHDWGWTLKEVTASEPSQNSVWVRKGTAIRAACFSPSGKRFATACNDGQVLVWSGFSPPNQTTNAGAAALSLAPLIETELRLGSGVFDVAFLSENVLVTGGRDRTARLWDIHSATEIALRMYHEGSVDQVARAGADKLLTSTDAVLRIWRSEDYKYLDSTAVDRRITTSGNGQRVLHILQPSKDAGSLPKSSGPVRFWDLPERDVQLAKMSPLAGFSSAIAQSSPGTRDPLPLASLSGPLPPPLPELAAASHNGNRLVTVTQANRLSTSPASVSSFILEVWDHSTRDQPIHRLQGPENFTKPPLIAISHSGDLFVAATNEPESTADRPRVLVWKATSTAGASASSQSLQQPVLLTFPSIREPSKTAPRKLTIQQIAFGRYDNRDLLVIVGEEMDASENKRGVVFLGVPGTDGSSDELSLYAVVVSDINPSLYPHQENVLCAAFSDSGRLLVTGDKNNKAKVWMVEDLIREVSKLRQKIASTPDMEGKGREENESYRCIDVKRPEELPHSSDVVDLRFATDTLGSPEVLLATVSSEGEASVWTVSANGTAGQKAGTPEPKYTLQHDANILSVTFSPDGRWIVTGGADSAVRVWNTAEGKLAGIIRHSGPVEYAALLEDDRLVTASRSSVVQDLPQQLALDIRERKIADFSLDSVELKKIAAQEMQKDGQLRRFNENEYRDTARSAVEH